MDVLNLAIDLTQRPANPPAYVRALEALMRRGTELGFRPNPILLMRDSIPEPTPFQESPILNRALRISGRTNEEIAASIPMALGNAPTLVLSGGAWVAADWLARARDRFAASDPLSIVFPEIGVFNFRGYTEFVSYSAPSRGRHHSACLMLSKFAPVSFGSGHRMSELFAKGAFLGDPFSRSCWLQSWIDEGLGRLIALGQSAFFIDHSISGLLKEGILKRRLFEGPTEIPWLKAELQKLNDLDPRVPARSRVQLAMTGWPLPDSQQLRLSNLQEALPNDAIGIAVVASSEPRLQNLMIESAARALPGGRLCILECDSDVKEDLAIGSVTLLRLGIQKALANLDPGAQARIVLSLLASANPRNIVLFESFLGLEVAKAITQVGPALGAHSLTLMPVGEKPTPVQRELGNPDQRHAVRGVRLLAFDSEQPIASSIRAYGGTPLKVVSPWAPWEWRTEAFGLPSEKLPQILPDDLKIAAAARPFAPPQGPRHDYLGIEGVLSAARLATKHVATPVPSTFLCGHDGIAGLPAAKYVIARDGALPLTLFFSKDKRPDKAKPCLLIPRGMERFVPLSWKKNVLFFKFRVKHDSPARPSRLILYGLGYPITCPLSQLKDALSRIRNKLAGHGAPIPIQCYFPQLSSAMGYETDATYGAEFVRSVRKAFEGHELSWLDNQGLGSLEASPGTAFAEVNPGLFYSMSFQSQILLSKGIPDLMTADCISDRPPVARFILSSEHWIEAFEPDASRAAEDLPSFRELCAPLARHWPLADVLQRGGVT